MDMDGGLALWLVLAVVCGIVAQEIGASRGRAKGTFLLGFLFGPLGWLVLLMVPRSVKNEARRRVAIERRAAQLRAELAELEAQAGAKTRRDGDAAGFKAWRQEERAAGR
jgi:hypothetical protein